MQSQSTHLPVGTLLHGQAYNYQILEVLGQGSFGITYLADINVEVKGSLGHFGSHMKVAVKEFFIKDVNGREDSNVTSGNTEQGGMVDYYRNKFEREAHNLALLRHPNIVRVLESFHANGTVYYSMEYVEGMTLDALVGQQGRLGVPQTVDIARQIGQALQFMHGQGMLHLDVKPGNVMVKADGTAILIDFGLAKQYDDKGEPESSSKVGAGTPGYAPIEQASYREGKGFPVMMDVYALGGTVYKMLTGQRPPEASEILNDGFPMQALLQCGAPQALARCVEKAMAPLKKDRYQSIADMMSALDANATADSANANTRFAMPSGEDTRFATSPADDARHDDIHDIKDISDTYDIGQADIEDNVANDNNRKSLWVCAAVLTALAIAALVMFKGLGGNDNGQTALDTEQTDTSTVGSDDTYTTDAGEPIPADISDNGQNVEEESDEAAATHPGDTPGKVTRIPANATGASLSQDDKDETKFDEPAPSRDEAAQQGSRVYDVVEQMPSFPGGTSALMRYLSENIHYPATAQANGVQGRVVAAFVVETDGSVSHVSIVRSVDPSLDREAMRVVSAMPRWTPGRTGGKAVRVRYNVPISFRLN